MSKYLVRIAVAFLGFAAFGITAKAQVADQVIVNVPYQFVVAGTTLPAGTYRLSRSTGTSDRQLLLNSREHGVFVIPIDVETVSADKARFTFEQVGGQYFLTKIQTADHLFVLPVSKEAILEAQNKMRPSSPASGASGRD